MEIHPDENATRCAARTNPLKRVSYLHVRPIPARIRTVAAPLALIAEKNAKGTAKTVLKTRERMELLGLPSPDSREGRIALILCCCKEAKIQLTTIKQ